MFHLIALPPPWNRPALERSDPLSETQTPAPESRPGREPSPLPPPRNPLYRGIDFWRGLICLLIVARHTAYLELPHLHALNWREHPIAAVAFAPVFLSWLRVPLFFVISGYCLCALCDKLRRGQAPARTFVRRRARRIMIPYWISLLLLIPLAGILHALGEGWWSRTPGIVADPFGLSLTAWLGNLTLVEYWRAYLAVGPLRAWPGIAEPPVLLWGHIWTLSFEVLLYLFCAVLLAVRPRRILGVLIGVGVLAILPRILVGKALLPLEFMEFSLGALLYCQLNYFRRPAASAAALFFAAITVAALVAELRLGADARVARTVAVSSGFALLLAGLHRWDDVLIRARLVQPFIRCGRISYSIYLIHMPITMTVARLFPANDSAGAWSLLLVGVPLGIALSITAGWLLYQVAEAPLVRKKPSVPECERGIREASPVLLPAP